MTGVGFQIDPEALHTTGAAMEQAGGDLHSQWEALKQQTTSIKFGTTDMVAPLIQMTLMGAVAIADSCFGSSKDALGGHADALRNAAGHYADAESNTTSLFSSAG
jgi:hypothetical protein